jgi:hypothetical protein
MVDRTPRRFPEMRLEELARNEVDHAWVKSVRRSWKSWVKKRRRYPSRVTSVRVEGSDEETWKKHVEPRMEKAIAYLQEGLAMVRTIRNELLIRKGFFSTSQGFGGKLDKARHEVQRLLNEADKALNVGINDLRSRMKISPTYVAKNPQFYHPAFPVDFDDKKDVQRAIAYAHNSVVETVIEADNAISRGVLARVTRILNQMGAKSLKMGSQTVPDDVAHLPGGVRIVYDDLPMSHSSNMKARELGAIRDPRSRQTVLRAVDQAIALMKKKGVQEAIKNITFFVLPKMYRNREEGAHYNSGKDIVRIFTTRPTARLIVHELGHRYWFKFMRKRERDHFDKWFGQVPATTDYGAKDSREFYGSKSFHASVEDFAEVFADYVMGNKLSRDQVDRLKSVLGIKKMRGESISDQLEVAISGLSPWHARHASGRYRGHQDRRQDGRHHRHRGHAGRVHEHAIRADRARPALRARRRVQHPFALLEWRPTPLHYPSG